MKESKSLKMQATIVRLDVELHRALRIAALEAGTTMTEALRQGALLWLQEQKKAGKRERRTKK